MCHEDFLNVLLNMDLSMCVSFTETFCIVAADSISLGVPTLVSEEIEWASPLAKTETTDSRAIVRAISRVLHPWSTYAVNWHSRRGLIAHAVETERIWLEFVRSQEAQKARGWGIH
jgi:hypothetical protein